MDKDINYSNIYALEQNKCTGCQACFNCCPKGAIIMQKNSDGFLYPIINEKKCISCGLCKKICPILNMPKSDIVFKQKCYAVMADDALRMKSSSGGAFTILAENIINNGGYICGAVWTKDFYVKHIITNKIEDLENIRGSKYLQSDISNCFKEIQNLLNQGKEVMFIGTPCQVAGLKNFLAKEYNNLLLIDIVCHAVPSPEIFNKYLLEFGEISNIKNVNFRNKEVFGWKTNLELNFKNGKVFRENNNTNPFYKGFLNELCNRKSCATCAFGVNRQGDISIGDFWGIDNYDPKLNDNKGTGLVLVNTSNGQKNFDEVVKKFATIKEVPMNFAIEGNSTFSHPNCEHKNRTRFFDMFFNKNFTLEKTVDYSLNDKYDVGIFGIWFSVNYGAVLTNFALCKTIEKLGKEVLVIDKPNDVWPGFDNNNTISTRFTKKHFAVSKTYDNSLALKELNDKCNLFVSPSDQLWAQWLTSETGTEYFLDFVRDGKPKISYATSFGGKYLANDAQFLKEQLYLKRYNKVSVREQYAVDLLKNKFNIDAKLVLDPVFLIDEKEFLSASSNKPINKKFILAYILDYTTNKENIISKTAERLGIDPKIMLDANQDNFINKNAKIKFDDILGQVEIEDFINYFSKAEFIITDSFHGVCFATIFKKPFICIANERRGLDRFLSLLNMLNLSSHMVYEETTLIDNKYFLPIDYTNTYKIIEKEKTMSLKWLKEALEEKDFGLTINDITQTRLDNLEKETFKNFENIISELNKKENILQQQITELQNYIHSFVDTYNTEKPKRYFRRFRRSVKQKGLFKTMGIGFKKINHKLFRRKKKDKI